MAKKLRIAWFSGLHPDSERAAPCSQYFSSLILPELASRHDIELFGEHFEPMGSALGTPHLPSFHYLKAFERHRENPFDIHFYQLEDHPAARFLRIAVSLHPGIVLFHDVFFQDMGPEPILNSGWTKNMRRFHDHTSAWSGRNEKFKPAPYVAERELASVQRALFTSERDHREYMRLREQQSFQEKTVLGISVDAGSRLLPFPANLECETEAREIFSVGPKGTSGLSLGLIGPPGIASRAHKIFEAIHRLPFSTEIHWLIEESELEALKATLVWAKDIRIRVYSARRPERFASLLKHLDVVSLLSHSPFGQGGPYLSLSLFAGKPVLVSNFASGALVPDSIAFHIEPGETEASQIALALFTIHSRKSEFSPFVAAQEYSKEFFSPESAVIELENIFDANRKHCKELETKWQHFGSSAARDLLQEICDLTQEPAQEFAKLFPQWNGSRPEQRESIHAELGWKNVESAV
jgi:glycosyltransferase involved in cell wall biosynthesis